MRTRLENKELTIFLEGRIDSNNANEVKKELSALVEENSPENVVLCASELEYISSAGLRVILALRKQFSDLRITEASSEVYDIFDMTGFTEMMTVQKAYRSLDVTGCEVIGHGANGIVYRYAPDTIVKVFKNNNSIDDVKREIALAKKAFTLGIPTAIPFDIVKVGDKLGSVFELLDSKCFLDLIIESPEKLDRLVAQSVALAKILHSTDVGDTLPDMKAREIGKLEAIKEIIPPITFDKVYKMLQEVPHQTTLMHGDFQLKNVMMLDGEAILIDMDTLCIGNPVFEIANIYLSYRGHEEKNPGECMEFFGISPETSKKIWQTTLRYYFADKDEKYLSEIEKKAQLITYINLTNRGLRHNDGESVDFYKERLICAARDCDSLLLD